VTLKEFIKEAMPSKIFIIGLVLDIVMSYQVKSSAMNINHLIDLIIGIVLCGLTMLIALYSYKESILTFRRKITNKGVKKL
jgi:uncharacterized protein YacL